MDVTPLRGSSTIPAVAFRWWLAAGTLLSCLVACGPSSIVVGQGTGTAGGNGGWTPTGGPGGSMGGGGQPPGGLGGGDGLPTGGTSGASAFVPFDPQVSRQWRWQPCGSIPPMAATAVQAVFPPAGDALAVLSDDGRVLLYPKDDAAAPQLLRAGGNSPPASIAFSLDGHWLAEVATGVARVRDVATGTVVRDMKANSACTGNTVRFSAEGDHLLVWDGTSLCAWQTADGALVFQLPGNFQSAAMKNGRILTSEPSSPSSVKSWSPSSLDYSEIALELPAGTDLASVGNVVISPRADTFAGVVGYPDQVSALWSEAGALVGSFSPVAGTGTDSVVGVTLYSGSGALVLMGNEVVDVDSLQTWTNSAVAYDTATSIDQTGTSIAGVHAGFAGRAESGAPTARRLFGSLRAPTPNTGLLPTALSVSGDGARLAAATATDALLWRVAPSFGASTPICRLQQEIPLEVSFSASSGEVVSSGDGWGVFSADDGAFRDAISPPAVIQPDCAFNVVRFSNDGQWLALGGHRPAVSILSRNGLQAVTSLATERCQERGSFTADASLFALPGPELYRTRDWSLAWPAQIVTAPPAPALSGADLFRDVQFAPGEKLLLVSGCSGPSPGSQCAHALHSVSDGALVRNLPELTATRARFSSEGNWIVSGGTVLHVPTGESMVFDANAALSTFAPNGDIIAIVNDATLARYCRAP